MLTASQHALAADNYRFAYYVANRWANKQNVLSREELQSLALECLCNAAAKYDPTRGCKFINFASLHINHIISRTIGRKINRDKLEAEAAEMQYVEHDDDEMCDKIELKDAIDSLSPRRKMVIKEHYFGGLTCGEIAVKHSLSLRQVKYALQEARDALRCRLS